MPKPYSTDLRRRVIDAAKAGMTREEVVKLMDVGFSTIGTWLRLERTTGSIEPKKHQSGNHPQISAAHFEELRLLVEAHHDAKLDDLAALWNQAHPPQEGKKPVTGNTMGRTLHRAGLSQKKRPSSPTRPRRSASSA